MGMSSDYEHAVIFMLIKTKLMEQNLFFQNAPNTIRLSLEVQTLGSEALFLGQGPRSINLLVANNGVHLLNDDC